MTNKDVYMCKGNKMEKIIQRLLEKFQDNSEIGKVTVDEYDISFEEHPEMEFVLSEGTMRSFNSFNKKKEIYYEGRLFVGDKREVSIWSTDCESTEEFVEALYEMVVDEIKRYIGIGNTFVGRVIKIKQKFFLPKAIIVLDNGHEGVKIKCGKALEKEIRVGEIYTVGHVGKKMINIRKGNKIKESEIYKQ